MLVVAVKTLVGALWAEGVTAEFCYDASMSLEAQRTQAEVLCCEWFCSLAICNANDSDGTLHIKSFSLLLNLKSSSVGGE